MLPVPKYCVPSVTVSSLVEEVVTDPMLRLDGVGDINPSSTLKATTLIEGT